MDVVLVRVFPEIPFGAATQLPRDARLHLSVRSVARDFPAACSRGCTRGSAHQFNKDALSDLALDWCRERCVSL